MGSIRKRLQRLACKQAKTPRAIISQPPTRYPGPEAFLELLWCVARERPRHWVCEQCVLLHPTDGDFPGSRFYKDSPCKNRGGVVFGDALGPDSRYRIAHLHVELALKYARMAAAGLSHLDVFTQRRIQAGLDRILAPYTGKLTSLSFKSLSVWYTIRPKIVGGRFLVETVWSYLDDGRGKPRRKRDAVKLIHACSHQTFDDSAWPTLKCGTWQLFGNELGRVTRDAARCRLNEAVSGACPYCRTDFSVEGSRMRAVVRCWRDLGSEASPTDPDWKAQVGEGIARHEPGSVRALYESGIKSPGG